MKKVLLYSNLFVFTFFHFSFCQIRIAVLPFQNMDGDLTLNVLSYRLQDSIANLLREKDPQARSYVIIPIDSIDILVSQFNLDPLNPQYPSDMWKAVKDLKADIVISGTFNRARNAILLNAYIYDVETKLPYPDYQARNIFKNEKNSMEAVHEIVKKLLPGILK
ncbi:MAG: hypothetical protein ACUVQ1_00045 [Candidatus Kapaibacteriales bacterium]